MRVGVSLRSSYPVADARLGARWMLERTAAARDAGLDSLFVGDHHVAAVPYYQNTPILARLLAEWGDRPAGALFVLPLWHPVLVAEQVGVLAALAAGPFILQCAVGGDAHQFAGMGSDMHQRARAFEAGLDIVRRLLAGETVSAEHPCRIEAARIAPLPPEPVAVWIGGHAPRAVDRAARLGDGWIAGPDATDAQAASLVELYRERCAVNDRPPGVTAIRRDLHVGRDDADAESTAEPVLAGGYRGFDIAACVVGGPERVAERFAAYAAMGYSDVLVRQLADAQEDALASMARLAQVRALVGKV